MFEITPQTTRDLPRIEALLDLAFGPDRCSKSSYRFRFGVEPVPGLGLVAREGTRVVGTIRFWPVRIGTWRSPALLLGPLGVAPDRQGVGIGGALMREGLDGVARHGHDVVCLVGDPVYYSRFGFQSAKAHAVVMEGEGARFQVWQARSGALDNVRGDVRPWLTPPVAIGPAPWPAPRNDAVPALLTGTA